VVAVNVTDAVGSSALGSTEFTVDSVGGSPSIVWYGPSPPKITLGEGTTFSANVSGGLAPYSYSYLGLPPGCLSRNLSSLPCTPSRAGTFTVQVRVVDRQKLEVEAGTTLQVNERPTPVAQKGILGLPGNDGGYLLVAVGLVGIILGVALWVRRRKGGEADPSPPASPAVVTPVPPDATRPIPPSIPGL
jgi:hypothetical protein